MDRATQNAPKGRVASGSPLRTTATSCLVCGTATPERVLASRRIRDLPENQLFGGNLRIVECEECGLRYLNPAPHASELAAIYDYDSWADSTNANPVLQDHFERLLRTHQPGLSTVCEIGCGVGDFLARLESNGLTVTGVEFAEPAEKMKFKGRAYFGMMEDIDLSGSQFDAVCLLNTIEHLSDPPAVLEKVRAALRPGGLFLVRCPNSDLFHFGPYKWTVELAKFVYHQRLFKSGRKTGFTIAGFQHQHLFYFDKRSLTTMLGRAGFEVKQLSTVDPYNALRARRALASARLAEGAIASLRHILGYLGLGPELLVVASAR